MDVYVQPKATIIMKKSFRFVLTLLVCMSAFVLTGCKDTAALKAAVEEAAKACPITLDNLGEATSVAMGENEVAFVVKPLQALVENDKVDKSLIARYLALELQRKTPELVKLMVDGEFGVKCNIDGEEGDILVAPEELKKFSGECLASGGKVAPILIPLYNQQLRARLPLDIDEGLTLTKVKVVDGVETFFINVNEEKTKFETVRDNIVNIARRIEKAGGKFTQKDIEEKVKLSKINLTLLLPMLNELNYSTMFRYSTKSGSETYMELTSDEINSYLNPPAEEEESK